jgi:YD repeat-containing protein
VVLLATVAVVACFPAPAPPPEPLNSLGFGDDADQSGTRFEVRDPEELLFSFRLATTSARVFGADAVSVGRVAQRDGQGWQIRDRAGNPICDAPASTFGLLLNCGAEGSTEPPLSTTEIALQPDGSVRITNSGAPTIELVGDEGGESATLRYLPDGVEWTSRRDADAHRVEIHSPDGQEWSVFPDRMSALAALALVVPPSTDDNDEAMLYRVGLAWRVHQWERAHAFERLEERLAEEADEASGEGSSEQDASRTEGSGTLIDPDEGSSE